MAELAVGGLDSRGAALFRTFTETPRKETGDIVWGTLTSQDRTSVYLDMWQSSHRRTCRLADLQYTAREVESKAIQRLAVQEAVMTT